ncbi:hypothetical protein HYU45_02795 [Candidatus Daviesbacteria bacterium]|nr:hypothetical protein [Candidatus Daviesbacteria bacterium]
MIKKAFIIFSALLLIYMVWPGPSKISDFAPLPSSDKSTLEGDTIQVPNVAAYFSDNYRKYVVDYYTINFREKSLFPFPPLRLNHPPEYSWLAIKRHTDSTYLGELLYPLRDSLYVNGLEPFYEDGSPKFWGSVKLNEGENLWYTKTTLRYYPSTKTARIIVWIGIISSLYLLFKLGRRVLI